MGNTFGAHIFKRRSVGAREEVTIKLFKADGSPLNLSGDTDPGGGETDTGAAMVFKGTWDATKDYKTNEVVLFNPGGGVHSYIFTQDHNAAAPIILGVNNEPLKLWDPVVNQMDLVLSADSLRGNGGMAAGIYDAFAIKVNASGGLLSLKADDTLGRSQDLGANLWHLKDDGTWENVAVDDDNAGFGHPWIRYTVNATHTMPGVYAFYISRYSTGMAEATAYGTSRVTVPGDNTAPIGSFADFPLAKTAKLG